MDNSKADDTYNEGRTDTDSSVLILNKVTHAHEEQ